jgi:hypothetical protein
MRSLAALIAALLVGAASAPASAQNFRGRPGGPGDVRPLNDILDGIRRERPGSLADVQGPSAGPAGDPRYRLKWLTPDGRVLWLDTDARTGQVLGVEGDDRGPGGPPAFGGGPRDSFAPPSGFAPPQGRGRPGRFRER